MIISCQKDEGLFLYFFPSCCKPLWAVYWLWEKCSRKSYVLSFIRKVHYRLPSNSTLLKTNYCLAGQQFFYKSVELFSFMIVRGLIDQKFQLKDWTLQLANINPKCPYTTDIVPHDNHQFRCLYKHLLRPFLALVFTSSSTLLFFIPRIFFAKNLWTERCY